MSGRSNHCSRRPRPTSGSRAPARTTWLSYTSPAVPRGWKEARSCRVAQRNRVLCPDSAYSQRQDHAPAAQGKNWVCLRRLTYPAGECMSDLREHRLHLLRQMVLIRRFEEKCAELYTQQKIRGFLHLYIGEEAVGVGVIQALRPDDAIVSTYREHEHALGRDIP